MWSVRYGQPQDNHGSWKKKMDRVEQAEPRGDHIIIAIIAAFIYRLYRVHTCMQGF